MMFNSLQIWFTLWCHLRRCLRHQRKRYSLNKARMICVLFGSLWSHKDCSSSVSSLSPPSWLGAPSPRVSSVRMWLKLVASLTERRAITCSSKIICARLIFLTSLFDTFQSELRVTDSKTIHYFRAKKWTRSTSNGGVCTPDKLKNGLESRRGNGSSLYSFYCLGQKDNTVVDLSIPELGKEQQHKYSLLCKLYKKVIKTVQRQCWLDYRQNTSAVSSEIVVK